MNDVEFLNNYLKSFSNIFSIGSIIASINDKKDIIFIYSSAFNPLMHDRYEYNSELFLKNLNERIDFDIYQFPIENSIRLLDIKTRYMIKII